VEDVDPEAAELTASFDGRIVTYGFGELDTLVPAYAATIHKSQGSEYPAVVIPALMQHYTMLQRNLLYTGVTRGKKLVILVGQKKAIARRACDAASSFASQFLQSRSSATSALAGAANLATVSSRPRSGVAALGCAMDAFWASSDDVS
jgi:ATP-dependent exoDNAse (exonuclease V) alpha subunit